MIDRHRRLLSALGIETTERRCPLSAPGAAEAAANGELERLGLASVSVLLLAAGPGGIYVLAPDGTHLGSLETGGVVSNVAWGEDGSVLPVTGDTAIYRIRLSTRGAGF